MPEDLPPKAPTHALVPIPIIGVPFEKIDIVGSLPKSSQGHEYILVIVDYTIQ